MPFQKLPAPTLAGILSDPSKRMPDAVYAILAIVLTVSLPYLEMSKS